MSALKLLKSSSFRAGLLVLLLDSVMPLPLKG
jgi:hypothetical protein